MTLRSIIDSFNKHFYENIWMYLLTILFIATGMILGLYCVKYMGDVDKSTLINYITAFGSSSTLDGLSNKEILMGTLKNNIPIIIGFWFLGLTVVGLPIIILINIYKGFSLGFTFSFFIYGLKEKGLLLSLLGVLPQNLIYIPCLIFLSVLSIEFSIGIVKEKFTKKYSPNTGSVKNYTMMFLIVTGVMFIGFLFESFITPILINFALKGLGA
ncbi:MULTISPECIES: stage II sporulation protein M [unclassified Clostridium]|uniref:stage II sporulation protein M n=1 Tax=unclassified Clostridium TaxID=2614128 RepID=UPI000E9CFE0C|nr:stage II sporulation protein M [Clostridium sp.]